MESGESTSGLMFKREIGVTEGVALATFAATAGAALYNIGAFSPVGLSLVSLLTIEDIFLGAATSFVLLVLLALAISLVMLISNSTSRTFRSAAGWSTTFFLLGIMIYTFWAENILRFAIVLIAFLSLLIFVLVRRWRERKRGHLLVMACAYLAAGAFGSGVAISEGVLGSIGNASNTIVSLSDGSVISGKLFRATSSYLFLVNDKDLSVVPLSEVRSFNRQDLL